jgi:membrane protease YdiL (CAAX protease family)
MLFYCERFAIPLPLQAMMTWLMGDSVLMEAGPQRESTQAGWRPLHGAVFLGVLLLARLSLPPLPWPSIWVIPLAGYAAVILLVPPLRRTFPGLPGGKIGWASAAVTAGVTLVACGVLVGYQALFRPELSELARGLPVAAFGNLVLAWICFSIANAVLEEIVFRGVLFDAVEAEWGAVLAVVVTAVAFGVGHLHGYPPGSLGAVLAGVYGGALGVLRWWSGGLWLPIASHVCADATIFGILVATGAFATAAAP